ncbi:MAG: histidine kinase, partial [Candidatus Eremiobacteraeota bacterium]|nr:histidine kinase [Candidatus Eremiobacteraeota bacterium]
PMEASNDVVWYAIVVAAIYAWDRLAATRRAELDAADLRTKLAEAQLENLRLQLHPHFLFNTLNAVSSVMYEDVSKADAMLTKLSDFLRIVLGSSTVQQVTLDEELAIERMYVEIMTSRLERSLQLRVRVDAAARVASVPFLILQPLLENCIRHGVTPSKQGLAITIDVAAEGASTVIRVEDDGRGLSREASGNGHGLRIVRERLRRLYGDNAAFSLEAAAVGGTIATVTLPARAGNQ